MQSVTREAVTCHEQVGQDGGPRGGAAGFGRLEHVAGQQDPDGEGDHVAQHSQCRQQGEVQAAQQHKDPILHGLHHHLYKKNHEPSESEQTDVYTLSSFPMCSPSVALAF